MGKPIVKEYGQDKTILKYFDYKAFTCLVPQSMAGSADANGLKIVKAGTPFPANNATCKGYLLHDVDVTQGDAEGACIYEGAIDSAKVTANGVTVDSTAKGATPRVTFF